MDKDLDKEIRKLALKGIAVNNTDEPVTLASFSGDILTLGPKEIYIGGAKRLLGISVWGTIDFMRKKGFTISGEAQYNSKYFDRESKTDTPSRTTGNKA